MKTILLTAFLSLAIAHPTTAQAAEAKPAAPTYKVVEVYPLATCVVSGHALDPKKVVTSAAQGRTFQTCSEECGKKIAAAPEEFVQKLDAAIVAAQTPFYPLTTCPISNEKIEAGKGKTKVVDGLMVQYCCTKCATKGDAKKAEVTQKVRDAAYAAQAKSWTLEKCPATDDKLKAGETTDVMVGMRLVKLCCDDCVEELRKNPAKVLGKLPAAASCCGESCCGEGEKKGECCAGETAGKSDKEGGCCEGEKKDAKDPKAEKKDIK